MKNKLRNFMDDLRVINEAYELMAREITEPDRQAFLQLRSKDWAADLDSHLECQRLKAIAELEEL